MKIKNFRDLELEDNDDIDYPKKQKFNKRQPKMFTKDKSKSKDNKKRIKIEDIDY